MTAARISMVASAFVLLVTACSGGTSTSTAPTSEDLTVASTERPLATTTTAAPSTTPAPSTTTAPPTSTDAPGPELEIWAGDVAEQIIELQFAVDDAGTITGTVSSPLDEAPAVPIDGSVDGQSFTIRIPTVAVVFEGEFSGDTLTGTWFQSGIEFPVTMQRREQPLVFERPQEPAFPFPYESTDVRFDNGDVSLAGTLVVPAGDGPFLAVVLVSGSGSQDRDETLLGHRPFLVLADAFARRGIASLRYDDRGVGGSTGSPIGATTADLATDAAAAVAYLDADPADRIGRHRRSQRRRDHRPDGRRAVRGGRVRRAPGRPRPPGTRRPAPADGGSHAAPRARPRPTSPGSSIGDRRSSTCLRRSSPPTTQPVRSKQSSRLRSRTHPTV